MTKERKGKIQFLLIKYAEDKISVEEETLLLELFEEENDSAEWEQIVEELMQSEQEIGDYSKDRWQPVVQGILNKQNSENGGGGSIRKMPVWLKWTAAASIVVTLGIGGYLIFFNKNVVDRPQTTAVTKTYDVPAPKETRAVITLADGTKVYLDSVNNGTIAQQENVNVVKNENGEIVYSGKLASATGDMQYNSVFNPRGSRVLPLTLIDGTKVWLNAESSLKYPAAFIGNIREVEITGEAYFEVSHDAKRPFHVKKGNADITVLGTHFNVNAYDDEDALRVTLLEGSVKVALDSEKVLIKPGQQAKAAGNELSVVNDVDVDKVMAWKDGWFEFTNTELTAIMRQLSRWYDLDIRYQSKPTNEKFVGRINKNLPLANVLHLLESNGVKFKIEGKTVTVTP